MTKTIEDITEKPLSTGYVTKIKDGGFTLGAWWLGIPEGSNPKVGDLCRVWADGEYAPARGVAFNSDVAYYRTQEEEKARHDEWVRQHNEKKKSAWDTEKESYFARISALPPEFHARFERFRAGNPDFDWRYGEYELMVCEQAVVIADALKTVDAVKTFQKQSWENQKKAVPALSEEHSGNSFNCAIVIAAHYLKDPSVVPKLHGAMVGLVGCVEYGCTHDSGDSIAPLDEVKGD